MFVQLHRRLFLAGLGIWAAATLALRVAGQHLLHPRDPAGALVLFAASFPLMAWVVRRLCCGAGQPREQWLAGAVSTALPTLLLDPFTSVFFASVFPNMAPEVAGVFGGWMLCCCAGAVAGAVVTRRGA